MKAAGTTERGNGSGAKETGATLVGGRDGNGGAPCTVLAYGDTDTGRLGALDQAAGAGAGVGRGGGFDHAAGGGHEFWAAGAGGAERIDGGGALRMCG